MVAAGVRAVVIKVAAMGRELYQAYSICHRVHVTECMSQSVCHRVYVTECMSQRVCHRVYVTECMSTDRSVSREAPW